MSSNEQNSNGTSHQSINGQNLKQRSREKSLQSVIPEPTPSSDEHKVDRTASTDKIKSASRDSSLQPSGGQHLTVYIYPNQISTPEQSPPLASSPPIQPNRQHVPQEPQRPVQTSQISPTPSGPAQRSTQSTDGQRFDSKPKQIQMSGQHSYPYPAQSQP